MRTKIGLFSFTLFLTLVAITLMLPGCEVDYYDPEANPGTGNSLFGDSVVVPAGFDWSSMYTVNVNVKVDDQYNGDYYYTVELFDSNPLFDDKAELLSKGVAKADMDYKTSIDLPASIETIYIQQTNPTGGKTIGFAEGLSSLSQVNYIFSSTNTSVNSSVNTFRSSGNDVTQYVTRGASLPTLPAEPSIYREITETTGHVNKDLSGGPIWFKGDFTGTTSFYGAGDIFISGKVNITNGDFSIPSGSRLIILPGGLLTTPAINSWGATTTYNAGTYEIRGDLQIPSNSRLYVYNEADFKVNNNLDVVQNALFHNGGSALIGNNLKISNTNGKILNDHSLKAKSVSIDNGFFENNGVVQIENQTEITNSTSILTNNNSFITGSMSLQGNGTVNNNCHLAVETLLHTTDSKIFITEGALLASANLFMNNSRIELGSSAMMEVTVLATYKFNNKTNNHGFYGTGTKKALLRIKKTAYDKKNDENIIHYQGNFEIECYDHTPEVENKRTRWTQSGITWAGVGGSTLVIAATECNNGGNNNTPSTPPTNPVFPIIHEGSTITYLFEDGWPYLGDFDMNDLVMDLTPTYSTDANNKVTQLRLDIVLRAIGATKRLGVGLQLDGVSPSVITNVTRSNSAGINGSIFSVGTNGLEQGQTYAVIPLFDVVHEALGQSSSLMTNTIKGSPNSVSSLSVPFTIIFNTPIDKASVGLEKFNVFLVNGGYKTKRQEIHMSGFQATDKADYGKFGFADDNSNVRPYTSKGNLIWGLAIPGSAKYPVEWTSIKVAYPEFESWATSSGTTNLDWYKYPNENAIYE